MNFVIENGVPAPLKNLRVSGIRKILDEMKTGQSLHPLTLSEKSAFWAVALKEGYKLRGQQTGANQYRVWMEGRRRPAVPAKKKKGGRAAPLVYLASPYSHADPHVRELRFRQAASAAARLMASGLVVFSPIAHGHPITLAHNLPSDWAYWEKSCRAYLGCCHKILVLQLDGWRDSMGVAAELQIAQEMEMEVGYMDFQPYEREGDAAGEDWADIQIL